MPALGAARCWRCAPQDGDASRLFWDCCANPCKFSKIALQKQWQAEKTVPCRLHEVGREMMQDASTEFRKMAAPAECSRAAAPGSSSSALSPLAAATLSAAAAANPHKFSKIVLQKQRQDEETAPCGLREAGCEVMQDAGAGTTKCQCWAPQDGSAGRVFWGHCSGLFILGLISPGGRRLIHYGCSGVQHVQVQREDRTAEAAAG